MRAVGIVCECNPIHDGHKYLIEQAKRDGAEAVICVMSGCFTQRGEAAVLDPQTRARMLIDGGADAVLELPFPFSSAGAEDAVSFFAAVAVLMRPAPRQKASASLASPRLSRRAPRVSSSAERGSSAPKMSAKTRSSSADAL